MCSAGDLVGVGRPHPQYPSDSPVLGFAPNPSLDIIDDLPHASCQIASNCAISTMAHCHNYIAYIAYIAYGTADLGSASYQRTPRRMGAIRHRATLVVIPRRIWGDVSGHTQNWLAAAALALHHSRGVIRNARLSAAVKLAGRVCLQQMLRLGDDAAREREQQAITTLHFHFTLRQLQPHGVSRDPMGNGQRGLVKSYLFLPTNGHQGINCWQALGLHSNSSWLSGGQVASTYRVLWMGYCRPWNLPTSAQHHDLASPCPTTCAFCPDLQAAASLSLHVGCLLSA